MGVVLCFRLTLVSECDDERWLDPELGLSGGVRVSSRDLKHALA